MTPNVRAHARGVARPVPGPASAVGPARAARRRQPPSAPKRLRCSHRVLAGSRRVSSVPPPSVPRVRRWGVRHGLRPRVGGALCRRPGALRVSLGHVSRQPPLIAGPRHPTRSAGSAPPAAARGPNPTTERCRYPPPALAPRPDRRPGAKRPTPSRAIQARERVLVRAGPTARSRTRSATRARAETGLSRKHSATRWREPTRGSRTRSATRARAETGPSRTRSAASPGERAAPSRKRSSAREAAEAEDPGRAWGRRRRAGAPVPHAPTSRRSRARPPRRRRADDGADPARERPGPRARSPRASGAERSSGVHEPGRTRPRGFPARPRGRHGRRWRRRRPRPPWAWGSGRTRRSRERRGSGRRSPDHRPHRTGRALPGTRHASLRT